MRKRRVTVSFSCNGDDDSNMKMHEREAVQSGELYGSEWSKAAAGAGAGRQTQPKGSGCVLLRTPYFRTKRQQCTIFP